MTTTTATLDGYFKERYADTGLVNAIPDDGNDLIASKVRLSAGEKLGDSYHQPIMLQRPMGWTFAGGATSGTAFALNAGVSGLTKDATVSGVEFVLREQVSYGTVKRGMSSVEAFGSVFDETVRRMQESSVFARELSLLYGGSYLGDIEVVAGSGTTRTWTLTLAGTSPAIWWQFVGGKLDCYSTSSGVPTTKRNTTEPITLTAVDIVSASDNRINLSVSGDATDLTACVATDLLVPQGAVGNWMTGLFAVAVNTGTLFGISAATYPLFKATSRTASSAQASMALLLHALKQNTLKSGAGKRTAMVSLATFTDLNNNVAALQRFLDRSVKGEVQMGTDAISFANAKVMLDIEVHPLMREGQALIVDWRSHKRIGSTDHTWSLGVEGSQPRFFRELENQAGFELRCYWDQGHYTPRPNSMTLITNIVNSI